MAQDGIATYPTDIWDGDSGNRDSDSGDQKSPDWRDWERMLAEMRAVQQSNSGYDPTTLNSYGAIGAASGLSVAERGNAAVHKTIITMDELAMTMTDGSTPGTDAMWGTVPLYTFPEGHIVFLGAHLVFPLGSVIATVGSGTGLSDTADLEMGVGTTARANQTNFALAAAERNICPENVLTQMAAAASVAIESSPIAAELFFDGSAGAAVANLNFITSDDADAGTTADELSLSGTLTVLWTMMGDD